MVYIDGQQMVLLWLMMVKYAWVTMANMYIWLKVRVLVVLWGFGGGGVFARRLWIHMAPSPPHSYWLRGSMPDTSNHVQNVKHMHPRTHIHQAVLCHTLSRATNAKTGRWHKQAQLTTKHPLPTINTSTVTNHLTINFVIITINNHWVNHY